MFLLDECLLSTNKVVLRGKRMSRETKRRSIRYHRFSLGLGFSKPVQSFIVNSHLNHDKVDILVNMLCEASLEISADSPANSTVRYFHL